MKCVKCGKELSFDEVGMSKKLLGRKVEEFYCLTCLSEKFKVERKILEDKMAYFKSSGCLLFIQNGKENK